MKPDELNNILERTLADRRLTRSEQQAIKAVLAEWNPKPEERARVRAQAFAAARASLAQPDATLVLEWLDEFLKLLDAPPSGPVAPARNQVAEAHFSPGYECLDKLLALIDAARSTLDVCVFTITDDRISRALVAAHRDGKKIRVITDDEKSFDPGSDIGRLEGAGLEVRIDRLPAHMHHKFCIFDRSVLVTGSYNWTRSAAEFNFENLLVSDDRRHVEPFQRAFEDLWKQLNPRNQSP